jgi:hypothetical protein
MRQKLDWGRGVCVQNELNVSGGRLAEKRLCSKCEIVSAVRAGTGRGCTSAGLLQNEFESIGYIHTDVAQAGLSQGHEQFT